MKILNVVGARPNFMKMAPLIRAMAKAKELQGRLVHTGQHYDAAMSKTFFEELHIPEPDINLEVGSGSHAVQTAQVMMRFEEVLQAERPHLVLVVGDVNSTLACAVTSAKLEVPVAHVEAGLRSFDRGMPEEINRVVTDALSDLLFTTCEEADRNLAREGVPPEKIFMVGNVMIDTLVQHVELAKRSDIGARLRLDGKPYTLVTLHRPSNVDHEAGLREIFAAFAELGPNPVVFPVHPRTRQRIAEFGLQRLLDGMPHLILTDPLGYLDFLKLEAGAALVLTDSGGIQEETTYLQVPCLTLRPNTERGVTITHGTNRLVKLTANDIVEASRAAVRERPSVRRVPPLWDGRAAERIVAILAERAPALTKRSC
jgi:UDP-N-acetylglucosamine 2-epimerase (non-hydrolysing)